MASAEVDIPRRERSNRDGGDSYRPAPRERTPPPVRTEEEKQAAAKAEYEKLLTMRSGGTYIPPARLRALQAQITDKTSKEYQRMAWEALKKSINGLINKVNTANIKYIVPELFGENLERGRGLFCRSIMKAQAASLPFTPIYAAMAAIVNSKLPQVGELLVKRLVMQFRKGFRRNDKAVCLSSTTFIAHMINQQVQHEMLAGQILLLLLNKPTDDSVEIAVGFCREVGQYLEDMQPTISMAVFDQFRNILHNGDISKRTQYMVEVLFQVRKDRFKDNPVVKEELDLVEEEDQITHGVQLDGEIDVQDGLNIFKFDPEWEEHEEAYKQLKAEILGEGSDYDDDEEDDDDDDSSDEEEDQETKAIEIKDQSNADLVNLRRTIYLTMTSSANAEEAVHKLMKINLPVGQEHELPSMVIEYCSQQRTYTKFSGAIAERLAKINRLWSDLFEQAFAKYYETIHRYEAARLRNIAQLFAHMFASDALGWHCLSVVHLTEEATTASTRVFLKYFFNHIAEEMGRAKLTERLNDPELQQNLGGMFPRDTRKNIAFSINFLIAIELGAATEESRKYLENMPRPALPAPAAEDSDSDSVSSYSSYTGSSYSRSRSRSRTPLKRVDRGRSTSRRGSQRNGRDRSYSSYSRSRSRSRSFTPDGKRGRRDDSYSRSPPPPPRRGRDDSYSRSRSPPRRPGRGKERARSASYSSYSRSPSPPPAARRRRDASYSASPPRDRRARSPLRLAAAAAAAAPARRNSSSVGGGGSPAPKRARYSRSPSYDSRSPPPAAARRRRNSSSSGYSRSRSPPPPRSRRGRDDSKSPAGKRRRSRDVSVSRSPPPMKRGRRGS